MCGIAGILWPGHGPEELAERVLPMQRALAHRGPDDVGLHLDRGIALAHTRLSIIDPAGGRQPLSNEDGTVHLVVNGEIYNYRSLEKTLTGKGHRFHTRSDCETVVHLYEECGPRCVEHLEGMFAFALWDARENLLLLARDRFGIKPLYLAMGKGLVCFASEMEALLRSGLFPKDVDTRSLHAYLALSYVPGPHTIIKGIRKLRPAERLVVRPKQTNSQIYWCPRPVRVPSRKSAALEELRVLLEASVRAHLVADVPVAAFLSGGVDSSLVVALAARHKQMETFCVTFVGEEFNEAPFARRVARHLGTRHHEVPVRIDPLSLLEQAMFFLDEPFADSSALPTFAVCREARKVAKVVLSGDGGDEVFGGYTGRYRVAALQSCLKRPGALARLLRMVPPWRSGRRASLPEMLDLAAVPEAERYVLERQITTPSQRAWLLPHHTHLERKLTGVPRRALARSPSDLPVHRALWMDQMTSLPDDMLFKVDRMSMAHGLEVRVPLLDHRVVEYALSLPPAWLVSPLPIEGKRLLRKAAAPLLPKGILRRPKHGFVVPLNRWLKRHFLPMMDDLFAPKSAKVFGYVDESGVRALLKEPMGQRPREDLYALLVLELWLRRMETVRWEREGQGESKDRSTV